MFCTRVIGFEPIHMGTKIPCLSRLATPLWAVSDNESSLCQLHYFVATARHQRFSALSFYVRARLLPLTLSGRYPASCYGRDLHSYIDQAFTLSHYGIAPLLPGYYSCSEQRLPIPPHSIYFLFKWQLWILCHV